METIKNWASYISQGYHYAVQETMQIGSDAVLEAGNIYSDVINSTTEILNDMVSADWNTTEAKNNKVEDLKTDQVIIIEKEKVNLGIFTVENYSSKIPVAHVTDNKKFAENTEQESNV